ncbi:MAG: cation diffusion facilitator family transporter [Citrobacter sp.]|uniref:cation diffusion facilitator family transporter n=1 Tax=Citrobacter sp. TaxID=1896336 RepID=UPI002FCC39BD
MHTRNNDSQVRASETQKCTLVSVILNVILSIFQVAAGMISGSQGLIADGIHSFSDLFSDFVVMVANKKSQQDSDNDHHYGHLRFENGAKFIIGGILLFVGLGMLWSAGNKLFHGQSHQEVKTIALWVSLLALGIKEILFRYMLATGRRINSSLLIANAWHARSDAASSVVVAFGITGNLLGLHSMDLLAAFIVAIFIARMGYLFASDALHDLMDRSVDAQTELAIRNCLLTTDGVLGLHDLKTRKMGDYALVDVHLEVSKEISIREGHDIAVEARKRVMNHCNVLNVMTHIDPDH